MCWKRGQVSEVKRRYRPVAATALNAAQMTQRWTDVDSTANHAVRRSLPALVTSVVMVSHPARLRRSERPTTGLPVHSNNVM